VLHFLLAFISILRWSKAISEEVSFKGKDPDAKQKCKGRKPMGTKEKMLEGKKILAVDDEPDVFAFTYDS
jgi:hypothetical protein